MAKLDAKDIGSQTASGILDNIDDAIDSWMQWGVTEITDEYEEVADPDDIIDAISEGVQKANKVYEAAIKKFVAAEIKKIK